MQTQGGQGNDGGAGNGGASSSGDGAQGSDANAAGAQGGQNGAGDQGAAGDQGQQQQQQQQQQAPVRPDYIPENLWDAEKGTVKADDLGKILQAHADRQAKAITDPTKVELKTELKDAKGESITFDMDAPVMKAAAAMAKDRGWTTDDLTAMGEIVVKAQLAAQEADLVEYRTLGNGDMAKADARFNAVIAKGAALLGADEQGAATPEAKQALTRVFAHIHTRADFETLEKLINGQSGPGAAASGGNPAQVTDMAASWYPNEAKKAS